MLKSPLKVLVCDSYSPGALGQLKAKLNCEISHSRSPQPTAEELKDIDALLIRSRTQITLSTLEQAPHLRAIVTATSGFDHIDWLNCQKRHIHVAYTPEANVESAAQWTLTLMLNLTRHFFVGSKSVEQHRWRENVPRGKLLDGGMNLGLIGLGRIGQRMAQLGQALGLKILACDPYQSPDVFSQLNVERLGLSEILLSADILSLHVPLTAETYRLINYQTLRHMNPEAYLINTSRGEICDETEVIVALDEGLLSGVALDVFEREPLPPSSRLRKRAQVLLSPHMGAYTEEALERASIEACQHLIQFVTQGEKSGALPSGADWFASWLKLAGQKED